MYALLFGLVFGQCGPGGCAIPQIGPQPPGAHTPSYVVDENPSWPQTAFDVLVDPPGARVWFDDHEIHPHGGKARLYTPPMDPSRRYRYRVTARWGDVERRWIVTFSPGQTVQVVLRRDEGSPTGQDRPEGNKNPSPNESPSGSSKTPPKDEPDSGDSQLPVIEQDGVKNFGLVRSELAASGERITLDGQPITRTEATRLLQAGSLADDSDKLRLTVIGSEADRKRVLDDLKGPLADIAGECLVQDYPPDHWAVAQAGFWTGGKPTIYLQAPDGTVLHRQDDYADGAEGLRQAFERIRRPDPNYDPRRDPDRRRPGGGFLSGLLRWLAFPFRSLMSWLAAGLVIYLLVAAVAKGWLVYLLGLLAKLVPSPPQSESRPVPQPEPQTQPEPQQPSPPMPQSEPQQPDRLQKLEEQLQQLLDIERRSTRSRKTGSARK